MATTKIAVCSSAKESNVQGLLNKLSEKFKGKADVKYVELPYNDVDKFQLPPGKFDGLILCHSIHNRRLAITDVLDALYDSFLPHVAQVLGKDNVAVIAHDFEWQPDVDQQGKVDDRMAVFRSTQPTTFQCASPVMTCGKLDENVEMTRADWQRLKDFVRGVPFPKKEPDQPDDPPPPATFAQMDPVTIAKIIVPLILVIVIARILGNMSMTLVSLMLYVLVVARWLIYNDVPSGASRWMGKVQSAKAGHHRWPRSNVQRVPWQKIPSKMLAYYSGDDAPKSQVIFEIVIRVVSVLWFLVVIFGVTNYYPMVRLALVGLVMEPFACWLWMTAGRMKDLKTDILSGTSDVGSSHWFAVKWQHILYSFWLYHGQVLATNPKILEVSIVVLNGFFCLYLLLFGYFTWGTLFVVTSMIFLQPLGYWLFFNAGKNRSLFLKAKGIDFESPRWSKVEWIQAPQSFWQNFAKNHFSTEHLRTTLFVILNETPWFFLVFYYDTGFGTLFRFMLVIVLLPFAFQLRSSQTRRPDWTQVPLWRVPDAFWLHYIRELISSAKLFHKVMLAVNIIVLMSLISFGDVGTTTLVRVSLLLLLEPMANMILLAIPKGV